MTTQLTTQDVLHAIADGEMSWPYNAHAVEDSAVESIVLAALGKPTDAPSGVALYRRAGDRMSPVLRLIEVVFGRIVETWSDFDFFVAPCDRCARPVQPKHSLWVGAGASVVDVHCCDSCRKDLDASLVGLVWN